MLRAGHPDSFVMQYLRKLAIRRPSCMQIAATSLQIAATWLQHEISRLPVVEILPVKSPKRGEGQRSLFPLKGPLSGCSSGGSGDGLPLYMIRGLAMES